ncbi:MAG: DUF4126 domain-containing protein [Anaerolineales bacterium]|nr:MAG: DUF4126 domain-containing protein [Anaerolineales bacterium]
MLGLATAFGLSTSAGLNAYIPLLVVSLLSRLTTLVTLNPPFDALESWWVIGTVSVLLVIEILVDKVPAADTVNDVIQTLFRPAAGAFLFAATTEAIDVSPVLAAICGVVLAGGVHAAKAAARPVLNTLTAGVAAPIVSTIEDTISLVASILAILAPLLIAALILLSLALFVWWYARRRERGRDVDDRKQTAKGDGS